MSDLEQKPLLAKVLGLLVWFALMLVTWLVASFAGFVTYEFAWHAQFPPDPPGEFRCRWSPPGREWWWLGGGLTLYGGLASSRMGRALVQGHIALLAMLSAAYLDHIRDLGSIYLAGARPWISVTPPILAASTMTVFILLGLWLWYVVCERGGTDQFSIRSLCAATAITAVVLGGLGEYARREQERICEEYRSHGVEPGQYRRD